MAQGHTLCYSAPWIPATYFSPTLEQSEGNIMGNEHAGVTLPNSQMLLFAQSWGPCGCPIHFQFLYFFVFFKPVGPGDPSTFPLSIFTILTLFLSSQCLSQGEEISMLFLPFIPVHSDLSKNQPFPGWDPHPALLPQ